MYFTTEWVKRTVTVEWWSWLSVEQSWAWNTRKIKKKTNQSQGSGRTLNRSHQLNCYKRNKNKPCEYKVGESICDWENSLQHRAPRDLKKLKSEEAPDALERPSSEALDCGRSHRAWHAVQRVLDFCWKQRQHLWESDWDQRTKVWKMWYSWMQSIYIGSIIT